MRTYWILYFLVAASILPLGVSGNAPVTETEKVYVPHVDSLIRLLDNNGGIDIFRVYSRLHRALYEVEDAQLHLQYNRRHMEDARAAGNRKEEAIAYILRLEALHNYMMPDTLILSAALEAMDFMRDVEGAEVHYFYAAKIVCEVYLYRGDYEEALRIAGKFYEEARQRNNTSGIVASLQTIGNAYDELGMPDKAEVSLRESIAAAGEKEDGLKGESYSYLIDMLNAQGRYEDALVVCGELEGFLDEISAWDRELKNLYYLLYDGYTRTYINMEQYGIAEKYLSLMESFPMASTLMGSYDIGKHRVRLLLEEGRYLEAEQIMDTLLVGMEEGTFVYSEMLKLKELRAELYYRWGLFRKAADIYKDYIVQKDSVQRVEMAGKLGSLRTRYEVDRLEMEHELQDQKISQQKNTITFAFIIMVLILAGMLTAMELYRKKRNAYRSLAIKVSQWAGTRDEIPANYQNNPGDNLTEQEVADIAHSLESYMYENKPYLQPDLSLESLAGQTGINKVRLSKAINRTYGLNFKQFISELRVKETIRLMDNEHYSQLSLEQLMEVAGFNSRSAFYESFKKATGLTPVQYWKNRKMVRDK